MSVTEGAVPDIGRRERKKDITRRTIRTCAVELFLRQGFTETTVEQIADAAEVAPRTFFRYFRTKESTLFAHESFDKIVDEYRAAPPEVDPLSALIDALRRFGERDLPPETVIRRNLRRSLLDVPAVARYTSGVGDSASDRIRTETKHRLGVPDECFDYRAEVMAGLIRSFVHTHIFQSSPDFAPAAQWLDAVTDLADAARGGYLRA